MLWHLRSFTIRKKLVTKNGVVDRIKIWSEVWCCCRCEYSSGLIVFEIIRHGYGDIRYRGGFDVCGDCGTWWSTFPVEYMRGVWWSVVVRRSSCSSFGARQDVWSSRVALMKKRRFVQLSFRRYWIGENGRVCVFIVFAICVLLRRRQSCRVSLFRVGRLYFFEIMRV